MTNDCKTCPVSTGTHKPAEAVHQIDEPQAEALRLADDCEESATHWVHEIDTRAKAAKMLRAQHARIAELEQRLEIDPRHRYDGISARDATIEAQDERIAELESQLESIGAGGVEPLRTPGTAPSAAPVPDERAAFEAWLRVKPCGAAHDFGWAAWKARAALAATHPTQQRLDAEAIRVAVLSCGHSIERDYVKLRYEPEQEGRNALNQLSRRIAAAIAAQAKQGEQP